MILRYIDVCTLIGQECVEVCVCGCGFGCGCGWVWVSVRVRVRVCEGRENVLLNTLP